MGCSHHEPDDFAKNELINEIKKQAQISADAAQKRLVDEIMGQARLKWPKGQIDPTDHGETAFAVAADPAKGVVLIQFSKPMLWLGLRRRETDGLIRLLQEKLSELPPE